jgi:RNA polymerase sigma factor (sigma-70 family)
LVAAALEVYMSPGIPTRLLATQSDERLLALVREGHERAFEALVHRYRRPLLSYCRRLPLPDTRAEDIIQLVLLKTWVAVREGAEVRDLKAWLYRVVHNTAVNAARDAAHDGEPLADPTRRLAAEESRIDLRLRVREALAEVAALPPLQREVIVRTAVAGQSHEQVANDLGLSNGAVRGLLYRARATLRTAITALTPPPLLSWMLGRADQSASAPERLAELAGGGGTVGVGGLLLKGGVVALTAGTVITGAAIVHVEGSTHRRARHGSLATSANTTAGALATADVRLGDQRGGAPSTGLRRAAHRSGHGSRGTTGAQARAGGANRAPARPVSATDGHRGPAGRPLSAPVRGDAPPGAPSSGPAVQSPSPPSGSGGSSGQGGEPSQTGGSGQSGGAEQSSPVGSTASSGSASGTEASGSQPQGSGEGSGAASGDGPSGSGAGSGSSSPEGSAGQSSPSESEPSSSSSGEQSGSLVGAVVHEVGGILEHLLH